MDYQLLYLVKQGKITKIGITDSVKSRFSAIKSDTQAGIKVLFLKRLPYTKSIECYLKARYKAQRVKHKGRGKWEWFRLNLFQRIYLVFLLNCYYWLIFFCLIAIVFVALYGAITLFIM